MGSSQAELLFSFLCRGSLYELDGLKVRSQPLAMLCDGRLVLSLAFTFCMCLHTFTPQICTSSSSCHAARTDQVGRVHTGGHTLAAGREHSLSHVVITALTCFHS